MDQVAANSIKRPRIPTFFGIRGFYLFWAGSTGKKRDSLAAVSLVREAGLEAVLCQPLLLRLTGKDGCSLPFWRPLGDLYPKNCICKLCYFLRSSSSAKHDFDLLPSKFFSHIIPSKIVIAGWHCYHPAKVRIYNFDLYRYAFALCHHLNAIVFGLYLFSSITLA